MTILSVCLNTALDITYAVPELRVGESTRATAVRSRAGGKAVNVARVLRQCDEEVLLYCTLGGTTGEVVRSDLEESSIPYTSTGTLAATRRTVAILDDRGRATVVSEPGGPLTELEWDDAVTTLSTVVLDASVLVLSGSLPPGLPGDAYGILVTAARERGIPSIVDAEGPGLVAAARAGASVLKPNIHELRSTLGLRDPLEGARALLGLGADTVVVSLGEDGLLAVNSTGAWRAGLPQPVAGNPTGAGDALVAALARGVRRNRPWPDVLRDGVALSAAAVLHPLAGSVDLDAHSRFMLDVTVEGIE